MTLVRNRESDEFDLAQGRFTQIDVRLHVSPRRAVNAAEFAQKAAEAIDALFGLSCGAVRVTEVSLDGEQYFLAEDES